MPDFRAHNIIIARARGGKGISAIRTLFAATVLSLPLFSKTRATVATFVPSALHRMRSTRAWSVPAVHNTPTVPTPVSVVLAALSTHHVPNGTAG